MTEREAVLFRNRLRDTEDDTQSEICLSQLPKRSHFDPRRALVATFLGLILIGSILLCTPWAQTSGLWAWEQPGEPFSFAVAGKHILENIFMATSTACITGLTVVDIATTYSFWGKVIICALIQLGGIGIMTLSTALIYLLLGRLSATNEAGAMLTSGADNANRARALLKQTIAYVFFFEAIGATILFCRYYWTHGYDLMQSVGYALFHAIAAFCNSGVSLHSENLVAMREDTLYIAVIMALVTTGSLGFLVIANLSHFRFWKKDRIKRGVITLHSRIVLWATFWIILISGTLFLAFEWDNLLASENHIAFFDALFNGQWHNVLAGLDECGRKIFGAFAQTTVSRTAGFNLFDLSKATAQTNFSAIFSMIIGGSPGSMAGGIKTTTIVVMFLTMRAMIRGQQDVCVARRTLPASITREAMVIVFFYMFVLFGLFFILLTTEPVILREYGPLALFFEATSALGTVGASVNSTTLLSDFGRIIICIAMFLGRMGPITIALIMTTHLEPPRIRYPEENVTVG